MTAVRLTASPRAGKKWRAVFDDGTHTDFGGAGYSDFTQHRDPARRDRYLARHARREAWDDFRSAGALSRWVLWNLPTLRASLADYRRRFGLSALPGGARSCSRAGTCTPARP